MTAPLLAIVGSGMVCGVGLSAPASCAAIRCALDNFQEAHFMDSGGEWIISSSVPLEQPWRGVTKLVKMLAMALRECIRCNPELKPEQVPVLLCLAEKSRPGRLDDIENQVFRGVQEEMGISFHGRSGIIAQGRVSVATALRQVRELIYREHIPNVIIAGVDSLLVAPTLKAFEERERLLTSQNSNGFVPGEAAAAVLVQPTKTGQNGLIVTGLGFGQETATVDAEDMPLRADGLVTAIRGALTETGCDLGATDFRITDVSGEQYYFKEAALALSRILRQRKEEYDLWHPADCIGEVGAAIGPAILTVLLAAMRKGYSPGNCALGHLSNDDGLRASMILSCPTGDLMANQVYANGREVSCKSGEGKTICAFPDVCFTPPENPATPSGVPIPYPNTGMSSDTTDGSKTLQISGKEVMLKNKSYFKKSTGDEAGNAAKKGVITSVNRGKVYFNSWSMDVKIEGENVVRHLDLTTHNHASLPGQTPPFPEMDGMSSGIITVCCDPNWTPCQKAQARAKVSEMNKMCPLTRRPGVSAADDLASSLRDLGNAGAKGFKSMLKSKLNGKASRVQSLPPRSFPKGDASDLMHPCMSDELKKNPKAIDGWSADHIKDLQFGGNWAGPFKMLDSDVNQSLGSQMSRGPAVVTEFRSEGCD